MAKTKKPESLTTPRKKTGKVKPEPTAENGPMIDTGLAAESAAKRVAAGMSPAIAGTSVSTGPARESASFKNLKDSLNKPASAGLASILDKTAGPGQKKQNVPFHAGKQVGRNQTFGADVNRTGVPRRTGGG